MTDPERDEEFETYLRRRSVHSRREPATEKLEPPHDLDDIVLRKARQAIHAPPQLPLYRAPRWALPVALAATILLCLSIVLNVSLNTHRRPESLSRMIAANAPRVPQSQGQSNERFVHEEPPPDVTLQSVEVAAAHRSAADVALAAASPADAPAPKMLADPARPRSAEARLTPPPHLDEIAPAAAPQQSSRAELKKSASNTARDATRDPAAWLRYIDSLRATGEISRADHEFRRFRAAFPAYPAKAAPPDPSEPPK